MSQTSVIDAKHPAVRLRIHWDTPVIGLAVFLFHIWHVPAVAAGEIFRKSNLAFDFDINRFVALWCVSPFPAAENEDYYAVRHPLAVAVRVLCAPIVRAGLDAHLAACGIAAFCAAVSAMLTFRIALALGVQRSTSYLLTAFWTVSTTPLLLGVLPETYGLALIVLALQFLLAIRWIEGRPPGWVARGAVATASFGITITNAVLSGLVEIICRWARQPFAQAVGGTAWFGASAGAFAVALSFASFLIWPVENVSNPIIALKQVYWSAASAERTIERQGPANVAWTMAVTSFVAPAPARYPTGLQGNPYLWDVRGQDYGFAGWAAVLCWLGLLIYGVAAAVRDRERWPIWAIAGLWAAFNVGLHTYWHFRGSVFLYSAHSQFAFFLLAMAGAAWVQTWGSRSTLVYTGLLTALILLTALNNLPLYFGLSQLN